jgi:hypothetical protein
MLSQKAIQCMIRRRAASSSDEKYIRPYRESLLPLKLRKARTKSTV